MKKKRLLTTFIIALAAISCWGAKASTQPVKVAQADGTTLTVRIHGDEHLNWLTTADGVLLKQVGRAYYIASVAADGTLTATSQLAHEATDRSSAERQMVKAQNRTLFSNSISANHAAAKARRIPIGTATPAYFPHTGSPKALVLLVEFSDVKFTTKDPVETFKYYLNGASGDDVPADNDINQSRNYGSVRQYFSDMSGGQFTPQFDVVGTFEMPDTSGYYGQGSNDAHYREMITKACTMAHEAGTDFSQYDQDGDGYADLVYIIYAGYGESVSGNSYDLWPKSGTGSFGTYDSVKVSRYGINNELNYYRGRTFSSGPSHRINGIGLFCHEFSHTLGLPDLYSSLPVDNQELEYWDLMDGGEYVDNGYTPTPYTPWEMDVMGWQSLTDLTDKGNYTLKPYDEEQKAYKVSSGVEGNSEYLILQNIQNRGWWGKLLGHGMLIYRIDYGTRTTVNLRDYPNTTSGKPGITLAPADGLLISSYRVYTSKSDSSATTPYSRNQYVQSHYGDPYPGTSEVTRIDSVKMNSCVIRKPIFNIKEQTDASADDYGCISFTYLEEPTPSAIIGIKTEDGPQADRVYSIDGRYVGNGQDKLPRGVYIKGNKKYVIR